MIRVVLPPMPLGLPPEQQMRDLHRVLTDLVRAVNDDEAMFVLPVIDLDGPGEAGTAGGGGLHDHTTGEALTGTGTSFMLAATPIAGSEALWFNTIRLVRVGSSPGLNEYTISGDTITLGFSKATGDVLIADYRVSTPTNHVHVQQETISGTGTSVSLSQTPIADSEVLFMNLIRLLRVASSPGLNEYTISGAAITLGMSKAAGDSLIADYLIPG